MKAKSQSSSPPFKPVMNCPVSGEVSYFEYYRTKTKYALSGNILIMLDENGNRSIFCDVDK
jgi:hypothetical protein